MALTKVHYSARINNLDALKRLVSFMGENGYLPGWKREGYMEHTLERVQKEGEHWFTNGANEFKIITETGPFGRMILLNQRALVGPKMDALFSVIAE